MGVPFDSQDVVNRLAALAQPRLFELLRLNSARHVYDPMPGLPGARHFADEGEVKLDNFKRAVQPYQSIERFLSQEKAVSFLVEPGLLPIVKAIALDARGRKVLVTRKPAPRENDRGAVGYLPGFGIRLLLATGPETTLTWECLYGVL
jgi:hypothetical protein